MILHTLEHTILETWTMFPLLYLTYIVLEIFERRQSDDDKLFFALQKYGPVLGALIGLIPQCGFSVLAAILFCQNNISLGTMIAVMVATSDEAIPILIANPNMYNSLLKLLVLKFIIGAISGYFIDFIRKPKIVKFSEMAEEEIDEEEYEEEESSSGMGCNCCYPQYPIWKSALIRSIRIFIFLFVTCFVLNIIVEIISEETLENLLMTNSLFQPLISAIFGFIPNCAATVVLSSLYASGELTFGSLLSGLITNSGLGLIALFQYGENKKVFFKVIIILYVIAISGGVISYFI